MTIEARNADTSASAPIVDISVTSGKWTNADCDGVRAAVAASLRVAAPVGSRDDAVEISVLLADDASVRMLNKDYRGKNRATNVLAFPVAEAPGASGRLLGDVALAWETIAREAAEQGKTFDAHLRHLVVHGVLHLLGFDHQTAREAEEMEMRERAALAALGIADPYRSNGDTGSVGAATPRVDAAS